MNKLIKNILIVLSIFIIGCEDNQEIYDDIELNYAINLPIDENGYYHMTLGENWQSLQRLTASLESEHINGRYFGERDLVETIKLTFDRKKRGEITSVAIVLGKKLRSAYKDHYTVNLKTRDLTSAINKALKEYGKKIK